MERRAVRFADFDQVLKDADSLATSGYARAGEWSLAQVCNHLATTVEKSMDGFPSRMAWPIRVLARWFYLPKILRHEVTRKRYPAPKYLQPSDSRDDKEAIERLRNACRRLRAHTGPMQPSPAFGKLTPEQWKELHLWHSEHHLSFLLPQT